MEHNALTHILLQDLRVRKGSWFSLICFYAVILGLAFLLEAACACILLMFGIIYVFVFTMTGLMPLLEAPSNIMTLDQNRISRAYYLSLPVSRRSMFLIMQIRALVFWLPTLLYLSVMQGYAYLLDPFNDGGPGFDLTDLTSLIIVNITLLVSVLWFTNLVLYMNLKTKAITGHLSPRLFWRKQFLLGTIFLLEILFMFLLGIVVITASFYDIRALGFLALMLVVTALRTFFARSSWLTQPP